MSRTRRTLPELLTWCRPERFRVAVVTALGVLSVGLLLVGPTILGNATNVVFAGIVGKHFPAGMTKAQAIAELRAHGQGRLADLFTATSFTPGAGVDFTRLGQVLGLAALAYGLSAALAWVQAYIMGGIVLRTLYRIRQAVEEKLA